jgi:hypothetical protein
MLHCKVAFGVDDYRWKHTMVNSEFHYSFLVAGGQKWLRLQEKARRYPWPKSLRLKLAKQILQIEQIIKGQMKT